MAFARHLQHANIENETSRHSGQFGCPQSRHFFLKRDQSMLLAISALYYYLQSH
jgi:hypothetical protein